MIQISSKLTTAVFFIIDDKYLFLFGYVGTKKNVSFPTLRKDCVLNN